MTLERYVTTRELALLMGVSERTVKRMVADGLPSQTWGLRRARRFLPSEAIAWAQDQARIKATNPPDRRANAGLGTDDQGV